MPRTLTTAVTVTSEAGDAAEEEVEAEELIELAVRQGAELVGLPENFAFLGKEDEKIAQAATRD